MKNNYVLSRQKRRTAFTINSLHWFVLGLITLLGSGAQAQVTGTVFRDYNANGIKDNANEVGVASLTVTAAFNGIIATAISTTAGSYSFSAAQIPNGTQVRLEFGGLLSGDFSGPFSAAAAGSGTSVQFVTAGSTAVNINFAVNSAGDYCQANPLVVTSCFLSGPQSNSVPAVVGIYYNTAEFSTAPASTKFSLGLDTQLGSAYGLAFRQKSQTLFVSAMVRHFYDYGPRGFDAIYAVNVIDPNLDAAPTPTYTLGAPISLTALGVNMGTNPRLTPLTGSPPYNDGNVYQSVGKAGIGDIEVSSDGDTLFAVNLNGAAPSLVILNVSNPASPSLIAERPLPTGNCVGGSFAPWALKYYRGKVYIGGVCTAETSLSATNLDALVYRWDGGNTFTQVLSMDMDYPRTAATYRADDTFASAAWRPWTNTWNPAQLTLSGGDLVSQPQPILQDIEFDNDGSMILGFGDRFTYQTAFGQHRYDQTTGAVYSTVGSGDIVKFCNVNGTLTKEGVASCPQSVTDVGTLNLPSASVPRVVEYYDDNYINEFNTAAGHSEVMLGGLLKVPGKGEVVGTSFDPIRNQGTVNTSGVRFLNSSGSYNRGWILVTQNDADNNRKGGSLGDLEALCNPAPIEIGNRVWRDSNRNGIQDPAELGISGVEVRVFKNNVQVAQATTSTDGEYYFSSGAGTNTTSAIYNLTALSAGSAIELRINQNQPELVNSPIVAANQGSNDGIDNDFALSGAGSNTAVTSLTLGASGDNNHRFDAGFATCPTITFPLTATTLCGNAKLNVNVSTTAKAPDAIKFVYFTSPLTNATDAYTATGGTVLGTVNSGTAATNTVSLNNVQLPDNVGGTAQLLYVYALLESADGLCKPVDSFTLTLSPRPEVVVGGNTVVCQGTSATLTAAGPTGTTYQWYLNSGTAVAGITNPFTTTAISTNTIYRVRGTLATCVSDEASIVLTPVPCTPCTASPTSLGGVAYRDFNSDGTQGTADPGLRNVAVTLFSCDANGASTQVATMQTDINGSYSFTGLNASITYRVEFGNLPAGYEPTFRGTQNGTTVQFTRPGSCSISLGLNQSNDYCQANPYVAVPCYTNGDPLVTGAAAATDALVTVKYDNTGVVNKDATASKVGSVWGLAWNPEERKLYSAAFLKRHVGLGPNGLGAIYVTNYATDPASSTVATSLLIDLATITNLGSVTNNAGRGIPAAIGSPSRDVQSFTLVGKAGLGDLDLSPDGKTLFATNLNSRSLIAIDLSAYNASGTLPTASQVREITIPHPGCPNGVSRPFALKAYGNKLYVGLTCTAENGGQASDLSAMVLAYNPATNTWDANPVLQFPLNYLKGTAGGTPNVCDQFNPWTDVPLWEERQGLVNGFFAICYPTPLLSDIEIDSKNGSMMLGFIDRSGHQWGYGNNSPDGTDNSLYDLRVAGDILRAAPVNGGFVLESAGRTLLEAGSGTSNNQGPGGGEYYTGDNSGLGHFERSMGGLAHLPGSDLVMYSAMDVSEIFDGGVEWLSNRTGASVRARQLYQSPFIFSNGTNIGGPNVGTQGKANGLGDLELLCDVAPIQIGNRVWRDDNLNGIQDPCEPAIPGAVVRLYNAAKTTELASVTTNAAGEYYFSSGTVVAGTSTSSVSTSLLTYNSNYALVITSLGTGTAVTSQSLLLADVSPVTPGESGATNSGATIANNDAKVDAGKPSIKLTTGGPGESNHTYDFGIVKFVCSLTATASASSQTIAQGQSVTLTAQISPASSYTYAWQGPNGITITPANASAVVASNLPTGVQTFTVTVNSSPTCSTTAVVSVTVAAPVCTLAVSLSAAPPVCNTLRPTITGGTAPFSYGYTGPTMVVTVASKNATHPDFGTGSPNGYVIDGVQGKELTLIRGVKYTFAVNASGHPFVFSSSSVGGPGNNGSVITAGVTNSNAQNGTVTFTPSATTPGLIYYQCGSHDNMGWKINVIDQQPDGVLTTAMNGLYSLTVTDAANCSAVATAIVNSPALPPPPSSRICEGGNLTFSISVNTGDAAYWTTPTNTTINSGTVTITNAQLTDAGNYTLTYTNAAGCVATAIKLLTVNPKPTLAILESGCVSGNQSYTVLLSTNASSLTTNAAQVGVSISGNVITAPVAVVNFTASATSAQGCTEQLPVTRPNCTTVCIPPNAGPDQAFCEGITSTTLVSPGAGAQWSVAQQVSGTSPVINQSGNPVTVSGLALAGVYKFALVSTSVQNCSAVVTVTVNPKTTLPSFTPVVVCEGQSVAFGVTLDAGDVAYWTRPANTTVNSATVSIASASLSDAGTFTLTYTNAAGCVSTATRLLSVNARPIINSMSAGACAGNMASVSVTASTTAGTLEYSFNGEAFTSANTFTLTASIPTTVTVVVRTVGSTCTVTQSITVDCACQNPANVSLLPASPATCGQTPVSLTAGVGGGATSATLTSSGTGVFSNAVINGSATVTYTPSVADVTAGSVTLTITSADTDGVGLCVPTSQSRVLVISPIPTVVLNSATICSGASVTLTATNGAGVAANAYTFAPAGGVQTGNVYVASPSITTVYSVTGVTGACSSTASGTVTAFPKPTVGANQTLVCANGQVPTSTILTAQTNSSVLTGEWYAQPGNPSATTFANATSLTTTVSGLLPGQAYQFVWANTSGCAEDLFITVGTCATVAPASLGDKVFADINRNGIQDTGDTPISGVIVTLISNGTVVAATTTLSSGTGIGCYSFTGLTPGVPYSVSFTTPSGYTATTPLSGTDKTKDSDPVGGITAPVTLTAGENNPTIDAGFTPVLGSIGDIVWKDLIVNGKYDAGSEQGVPGVTVRLLQVTSPVGSTLVSTSVVSSTFTDGGGKYLFTNLPEGRYIVEFDKTTLPADCVITPQYQQPGVGDALDSDADPTTGRSPIIDLVPSDPSKQVILTINAGLVTPPCPSAPKCVPITIGKIVKVGR